MCTLREALEAVHGARPFSRIGVANLNLIPNFLAQAIYAACGIENMVNGAPLMDRLRGVKSAGEIAIMRHTYRMGQTALHAGLALLQPGRNETDIVGAMAAPVFAMGAEQLSHCFYAGVGAGCVPALTFSSARRVIAEGDMALL
ncbi:MAG TPA: hypothetical protein PKE04_01180, partial [Clostridia bacterium]|nr:hypothetical protein [Clostridia bacterium]